MKIIIEESVDRSIIDLIIRLVKTLVNGVHIINGLKIKKTNTEIKIA